MAICVAWTIKSDANRIQNKALMQFVNKALKPISVGWASRYNANR